jgi:hypothetical protein
VSAKKQPGVGHTGSNVTTAINHLPSFCTIARPEIKYKNKEKNRSEEFG